MQLTFLGKTYTASPTAVNTVELNMSGKYRGSQVSFRTAQPQHCTERAHLKYRGIAYS